MHLLRHYARISLGSAAFSAFVPIQRKSVTDLIEDRLAKDITLDDLADAASRSPFLFARQVKAEFGVAPYACVIRRRILKAQDMLRQGKVAHKVVALECGVTDQSPFCRTFRKVAGTTPAQYQVGD